MRIEQTIQHFSCHVEEFDQRMWVVSKDLNTAIALALAPIRDGERFLSVGIGTGAFESWLLNRRPQVEIYGVDATPAMLERARAKDLLKGRLLVLGEGEELPFLPGTFDICFSRNLLKHTPRPGRVLQEMNRVLRAPGKFMVVETCALTEEHKALLNTVCQKTEPHQRPFLAWYDLSRAFSKLGFTSPDEISISGVAVPSYLGQDYLDRFSISNEAKQAIFDLYRRLPDPLKEAVLVEDLGDDLLTRQFWMFCLGLKK